MIIGVWSLLIGGDEVEFTSLFLTVVSWDLVEPEEGKFDFSMIDYQIEAARQNNVRLIFLWMASWKNGLSHFAPPWVKANQDRFPRVVNGQGKTLEILSTLGENTRNADARAFAAVMRHIRRTDSEHHTVIAMRVQNEVGVMGSTRDFSSEANAAFNGQVPSELTDYLQAHRDQLLPEFRKVWDATGNRNGGTWEEVFGKNVPRPANDPPVPNSPGRQPRAAEADLFNYTDEIFMAWNYSRYIGYAAEQGKKEYPLPMFVNAWIVQPNDLGPGDYPSGGPEPRVHNIWRAGAPAIDILAPDIYVNNFAQVVQTFARNGNPAFIPECRADSNNAWMAFTELNALCFSPFGIDNLSPQSPFARTYGLINSLSGAIAQAQGRADSMKLIRLEPGQNPGRVEMGRYAFDFTPPPTGQRGGARGSDGATAATVPAPGFAGPGALPLAFMDSPFIFIINTGPDEYYFASNGSFPFRVSPHNIPNANIAAPAAIDFGAFKNGKWVTQRRANGDDIMGRGYDVSAAAADNQAGTQIPLGARGRGALFGQPPEAPQLPSVMRVKFYIYH